MNDEKKNTIVQKLKEVFVSFFSDNPMHNEKKSIIIRKPRRFLFSIGLSILSYWIASGLILFTVGYTDSFEKIVGTFFCILMGVTLFYTKIVIIPADKYSAVQNIIFYKIMKEGIREGHVRYKFVSPGLAILLPWEFLFGDLIDVNPSGSIEIKFQAETEDGPLDLTVLYIREVMVDCLQEIMEISEKAEGERGLKIFLDRIFEGAIVEFLGEIIPEYTSQEIMKNMMIESKGIRARDDIKNRLNDHFCGKSKIEKDSGVMIVSVILKDPNYESDTQKSMEQTTIASNQAKSAKEMYETLGYKDEIEEMKFLVNDEIRLAEIDLNNLDETDIDKIEKTKQLIERKKTELKNISKLALDYKEECLRKVQANQGKRTIVDVNGSSEKKFEAGIMNLIPKIK